MNSLYASYTSAPLPRGGGGNGAGVGGETETVASGKTGFNHPQNVQGQPLWSALGGRTGINPVPTGLWIILV